MTSRGSALVCAGVIALTWSRLASADETQRVVMIEPSAALLDASRAALQPWGIIVDTVGGPAPDPTMPGSGDRARVVAGESGAAAVLWVTVSADGPALWAYDRGDDRVVSRRLSSPPPFDPPTAAAVALSIKTLLRHSTVAPEAERYGASAVPPAATGTARFRFEAGSALRYDHGASGVELRVGLGLAATVGDHLELAGGLDLGTSSAVRGEDFTGHVSDLTLSVAARAPMKIAPRTSLLPSLGASLHRSDIEGTIDGAEAGASRLNPSLDAGAGVRWAWPRVELSVAARLAYLVRRQRYLVRGVEVHELPTALADVGVTLSFPFL